MRSAHHFAARPRFEGLIRCCRFLRLRHAPRPNLDERVVARFCESHHIWRLPLFGSQAKETAKIDSDVDLLVKFDPPHIPSLIGVAAMEIELSSPLGKKKVDLRTAGILSRYFRGEVIKTAKTQYAG